MSGAKWVTYRRSRIRENSVNWWLEVELSRVQLCAQSIPGKRRLRRQEADGRLIPIVRPAADGLRPGARQNGYADFAERLGRSSLGLVLPGMNRFW